MSVTCAGDLWTPLLFLLFNGGDLGGRLLAGIGQQQHRPPGTGALLTYALSRVVLVIGLLLCHVITPHPWRLPELVRCGCPDLFKVYQVKTLTGKRRGGCCSVVSGTASVLCSLAV